MRSSLRLDNRLIAAALLALAPFAPPAVWARTDATQDAIYRARDRVFPALVHIEPILEVYRAGAKERMAVTGSGVIFTSDGYVVTNNHVVERAQRVTCYLEDQQEVPAEVVGRDPETDVAVIKLDISHLKGKVPHADLGDSSTVQVGQHVMAMGSPLGLARSVSFGVVSSVDRYLPEDQMPAGAATGIYNTWIQTDAAINPGNSGGPLVDLKGRVIGINSRAVPIFGENVGFAIPINIVKEVAKKLIAKGSIDRSWIGANWQPLKVLPNYLELAEKRGVVIGGIVPGSPAAKAGLEIGDLLLAYDGRPVTVRYEEELPSFRKLEADTPVGARVPLSVDRHGERIELSLVTVRRTSEESEDFECRAWGFTVRAINDEIARARNLDSPSGVIVTGVKRGSFAADAELAPGDIILKVKGEDPKDLTGFKDLYDHSVGAKEARILFVTQRGPVLHYHLLKPTYDTASTHGANDADEMEPGGDPNDDENSDDPPLGPGSGGS